MPLNFYEDATSRPLSRAVDSASVKVKWVALRSDSETAVYTGLLAVSPFTYLGLNRQKITCDPQGAGLWFCEVEYGFSPFGQATNTNGPGPNGGPSQPPPWTDQTVIGPEMDFAVTAQQAHITQSRETKFRWGKRSLLESGANLFTDAADPLKVTAAPPDQGAAVVADVGRYLMIADRNGWTTGKYKITGTAGPSWTLDAAGAAPAPVNTFNGFWQLWDGADKGNGPDYKQAIGVTIDRVEGTDIYVPHCEMSIKAQVFPLKAPYLRTIRNTCAKTNRAAFRTFGPGDVLYLGASGQCGPDSVWSFTHKFAIGITEYAVVITPPVGPGGGQPTDAGLIVPLKGAWEYLWCVYDPKPLGNAVVQQPTAAFVERVYQSADFAALGLGG